MVKHKSNREKFILQGSQSTDAIAFRPIRPHQCGYREINFCGNYGYRTWDPSVARLSP